MVAQAFQATPVQKMGKKFWFVNDVSGHLGGESWLSIVIKCPVYSEPRLSPFAPPDQDQKGGQDRSEKLQVTGKLTETSQGRTIMGEAGRVSLSRFHRFKNNLDRRQQRERLFRHEDSPVTKGIPLRGQADGRDYNLLSVCA